MFHRYTRKGEIIISRLYSRYVVLYDKTNNNITDTIFITQRSEARLNISMSNPGSLQGELNKLNINHHYCPVKVDK